MPFNLDNRELHFLINNVNLIYDNRIREEVTSLLSNIDNYKKKNQSIKINNGIDFNNMKKLSSHSNQDCPICCHTLNKSESLVSCPDCQNPIHKRCMEGWLSKSKTCVYCRSTKWQYYV